MPALGQRLHQPLLLESRQVRAGGRRRDLGDHGELGAGARAPVHQAVEHANPCGLPDRGGDPGHGLIVVALRIHISMLREL
jgi:hypothetical protein